VITDEMSRRKWLIVEFAYGLSYTLEHSGDLSREGGREETKRRKREKKEKHLL